MIVFIAGVTCLVLYIIGIVEDVKKRKERIDISEPPHTLFSVPDYFDRMEKLQMKLLQEREDEEPHVIVLWWGLDGLRLNADGTTEWISRRPKKEEHYIPQYPTYYAPIYPAYPVIPQYFQCNVYQPTYPMWAGYGLYPQQYGFNPRMSIQAQTEMLGSQIQALNLQAAQTQFNHGIITMSNTGGDTPCLTNSLLACESCANGAE